MAIEFSEQIPQCQEYRELRERCGLATRSEKSAKIGLPRSLYSIVIRDGRKLVGMGRIVGDLGCHVQITDIAVDPDYQGQGFGRRIMEYIMAFIQRECPETCFVNLFADVAFLYQKFGFSYSTKSKGMYLDRLANLSRPDNSTLDPR